MILEHSLMSMHSRVSIKGFSDKKKRAVYYWFQGFMQRFPELGVKSAENLSVLRAMSINPTQESQWFTTYEATLNRLAIRDCPNHIWNFDETGCQNIHVAKQIVGQVGIPTYNVPGKVRNFYRIIRIECTRHGSTTNDHLQR